MSKEQADDIGGMSSAMQDPPFLKKERRSKPQEKASHSKPNTQLREARLAKGLSQEQLAPILNVGARTVMRWESGETTPQPQLLKKLCDFFEKQPQDLGFFSSDNHVSQAEESASLPQGRTFPITPPLSRRAVILGGGIATLTVGYAGLAKWLQLWPLLPRSAEVAHYYYAASCRSLCWSPEGAYLASAHDDRAVLIWNKQTEDFAIYKGHVEGTGFTNAVAWCPTGMYLASVNGGRTPSVRVWTFPLTNTDLFIQKRDVPLTTVAWSHTGKYLAFAGRGPRVEIWEPLIKKQIGQFDLPEITGVQALSWSQDDQVIAVATNDKAIFFCNMTQSTARGIADAHAGIVETIAWSPVSPPLLASGSADGTVKLWVMDSNSAQLTYRGHLKTVTAIDWSPNGNFIVSASTDGTVHRWEVTAGTLIEKYPETNVGELYALDLSSNGKQLAFGGKERKIHVWSIL